jgi:hypothetical protein
MITTGFEIAFGIFLFILALLILVYGLTALSSLAFWLAFWLWDWASKRSWWGKIIVVLVILQILGGILGTFGVGK